MTLRPFGITRLIFFGLTILCSLAVLALVFSINSMINDLFGDLTSQIHDGHVYVYNQDWNVGHWAIGASAATLGTFIPLLILDLIRTWSLVAIELVVMAGLWVGWIISASKTTTEFTATHCQQDAALIGSVVPAFAAICHRYEAFLAFSWTTFGLIMVYTLLLVTLAIRAIKQGHKFAWFRSASSLAYFPEHTYDDKTNRV